MFCTKCGKKNKDEYNFCIYCGAVLKKPKDLISAKHVSEVSTPSVDVENKKPLNKVPHDEIEKVVTPKPEVEPEPELKPKSEIVQEPVFASKLEVEPESMPEPESTTEEETKQESTFNHVDKPVIAAERSICLKDEKGKEYFINNFPAVVGKSKKADCMLTGDQNISRQHVKIHEYGGDLFVVEDLKSTNKTFINGYILEPEELVVLSNGDLLKLGKTEFQVIY